jgi:uncharacterized protein
MKKITFRNSVGLSLVGEFDVPEKRSDTCIVIAHGFAANKDRERFLTISRLLNKAGFAVLRFDFAGSGESDRRAITLAGQVDDLKSAVEFAKRNHYLKVGVLAESFGALTALNAFNKDFSSLVLLAPVTDGVPASSLFGDEIKTRFDKDGFIPFQKDGREFIVPKQYVTDRTKIDQKKILSRINIPVLIIHGDHDRTIPLKHSERALKYLSDDSALEVVKNGSHTLDDNVEEIAYPILEWFKKQPGL